MQVFKYDLKACLQAAYKQLTSSEKPAYKQRTRKQNMRC